MGVNFGVIWAADFDNAIRFHVRQPGRQLRVSDFGVIWAADFDNAIRFYVR